MKYCVEWSREDMRGGSSEFNARSDAKAIEIFRAKYLQNHNHAWDFLQLFRLKKCSLCNRNAGRVCIASRLDGAGSTKYRKKRGGWVKASDLNKPNSRGRPKREDSGKKIDVEKLREQVDAALVDPNFTIKTGPWITFEALERIMKRMPRKEVERNDGSWGDVRVHRDSLVDPSDLLDRVGRHIKRKKVS